MRIGESLVMVGSTFEREPFPAFLCIYVADVDRVYARVPDAGAEAIEAPVDAPYGDRRAMIRDPFGNLFQIARRLEAALPEVGAERA